MGDVKQISVLSIVHDTIVDGEGFRTSVYAAGCDHLCPSCHNPSSWDINNGTLTPIKVIYDDLMQNSFTNVTFTGGDPFYQARAFGLLAREIKRTSGKTIWCYTGLLYEDILKKGGFYTDLLRYVDVLVDGKYDDTLKCLDIPFIGSSNQRIIDVQVSLLANKVILWNGGERT